MPAHNQKCSRCGLLTPVHQFQVRPDGRRKRLCYPCQAEEVQEKKDRKRSEKFKGARLVTKLTQQQYDELIEKQNGRCDICGRAPEVLGRSLAVDHNHHTNEVRGLLCGPCNVGLGMFQDNVQVLRRAIAYVNRDGR